MNHLKRYERLLQTEYGEYRLEYEMHEEKEDGVAFYGISIFQYRNTTDQNLFDQATIPGFSESLEEAEVFLELLQREEVFPVHLYSVADDWIALCDSLAS